MAAVEEILERLNEAGGAAPAQGDEDAWSDDEEPSQPQPAAARQATASDVAAEAAAVGAPARPDAEEGSEGSAGAADGNGTGGAGELQRVVMSKRLAGLQSRQRELEVSVNVPRPWGKARMQLPSEVAARFGICSSLTACWECAGGSAEGRSRRGGGHCSRRRGSKASGSSGACTTGSTKGSPANRRRCLCISTGEAARPEPRWRRRRCQRRPGRDRARSPDPHGAHHRPTMQLQLRTALWLDNSAITVAITKSRQIGRAEKWNCRQLLLQGVITPFDRLDGFERTIERAARPSSTRPGPSGKQVAGSFNA